MGVLNFILENMDQVIFLTLEHLWIVGISLLFATITGVPIGIYITTNEVMAQRVLNTANILMTVPSIALFGVMLPLLAPFGLGLGKVPAVIALILYSQLPIIRNTYIAIKNVDPSLVNAGRGIGLNSLQLLREVQIPLATPIVLAGMRSASVMNIGIATIAAYIGSGGLGVLIQQGITRTYDEMILAGALLVSFLAVIVDGIMTGLEWYLTPQGVKLQKQMKK